MKKITKKVPQKVAKLLTISTKYPLSKQLQRLTGDSFNTHDFEHFKDREILQHKASKQYFVVLTFRELDILKELELFDSTLGYFKAYYGFTDIEKIDPKVLFPDALAGVRKIAKPKKLLSNI